MITGKDFANIFSSLGLLPGKIVDFNPATDAVVSFDFTSNNRELSGDIISNLPAFSQWVEDKLKIKGAKFGIGGYLENRTLYSNKTLFSSTNEARCLHLGVDIWGPAGTAIFCPLEGQVHSFRNNDNQGDYGPTIILEHNYEGIRFYSLYGHLSYASLEGLEVGKRFAKGGLIARLGDESENGNWPPHLHFQIIWDLEGAFGDYPGVCKLSEIQRYSKNCPDPNLILEYTFS